jgi:hypothetical protein
VADDVIVVEDPDDVIVVVEGPGLAVVPVQLTAWFEGELWAAPVITRDDTSGAPLTASIVWPDGTAGTFTSLVLSTAFPGAVDSFSVTYGSLTITQPTITRDANGAPITRPTPTITGG